MENSIKMDDLGGFPLFLETPTAAFFRCIHKKRNSMCLLKDSFCPLFFVTQLTSGNNKHVWCFVDQRGEIHQV